MRATRTDDSRRIEYSATNLRFDGAKALQKQIVRFVRGIRRPRQTPVTRKQIINWFRATDPEFVEKQLDCVLWDGRVRTYRRSLSSTRRHNGGYVYMVEE